MTVYIERIVTEVAVENETMEQGEDSDTRWQAKQEIRAALKAQHTKSLRLKAEGLDD